MPFVWKLFVEASHFPTTHAKCWASPKPLCLLHSSSANCASRRGDLHANEGNGWHSWGTPALGTPPLLLRSIGTVAERLCKSGERGEGEKKGKHLFSELHSSQASSKAVQFLISIRISNPVIVSLNDLGKFLWRVSEHLANFLEGEICTVVLLLIWKDHAKHPENTLYSNPQKALVKRENKKRVKSCWVFKMFMWGLHSTDVFQVPTWWWIWALCWGSKMEKT